MATTSLWHIEGRLKDLIDYVENPEKTKAKAPELQDLYNVFTYVQRPEATQKGEYVTALNCLKETALRQMILTKKRYGKTDGYIAWHGYQSFKPEEVTPQLAHEIGVKLAKEMWGDRFEIIVTTHLDKEHIHCHFCFKSRLGAPSLRRVSQGCSFFVSGISGDYRGIICSIMLCYRRYQSIVIRREGSAELSAENEWNCYLYP